MFGRERNESYKRGTKVLREREMRFSFFIYFSFGLSVLLPCFNSFMYLGSNVWTVEFNKSEQHNLDS